MREMMNLIALLVVMVGVSSPALGQNGNFDWIVVSEQGVNIQKIKIPAKGTKKFEDSSGKNCVFSFISQEKLGTSFVEYRSKLECKKGGGSSSSEYVCLDSKTDAKPEIVKIKTRKKRGGFGFRSVTAPGVDKKDLKG